MSFPLALPLINTTASPVAFAKYGLLTALSSIALLELRPGVVLLLAMIAIAGVGLVARVRQIQDEGPRPPLASSGEPFTDGGVSHNPRTAAGVRRVGGAAFDGGSFERFPFRS